MKVEEVFPDLNLNDAINDEFKSIEETLNIDEVELNIDLLEVKNESDKVNFEDDYTFIRTKLIHSIQKGDYILDVILKRAQMMEVFKDYKVASQLLQSICEGSKTLMDLHKQSLVLKKDLDWIIKNDNDNESNEDVPTVKEKTLDELLGEVEELEKINNKK